MIKRPPILFHLMLLGKRVLFLILIMELCRFTYLVFNFHSFVHSPLKEVLSTFLFGLIFDLSSICYFNLIFILLHIIPIDHRFKLWYQRILFFLFVIVNSIVVFLNMADAVYYPFLGKRMGVEILTQLDNISRIYSGFIGEYWYMLVAALILIWVMIWYYPRHRYDFEDYRYKKYPFVKTTFIKELVMGIAIFILGIILIRGGVGSNSIRSIDATRFVSPQLIPLTINNPFNLLSSLQHPLLEEQNFMPMEEAINIVSPIKQFNKTPWSKKYNVVVITLQNFGKEYIGHFNNGRGYTPFLDSLLSVGLSCENAYSNGRQTIEALPAILSGMPSLDESPYLHSAYKENKISSVGKCLSEDGYSTGFYFGATNGTFGFDEYIKLSSAGKYSGIDQYPDQNKEGVDKWGIYDEPYMQYMCDDISKNPEPFCYTLFTNSSHHPYEIPEKYTGRFPKGRLAIHESIGYTDFALRMFFRNAKTKGWFKNTVFIITADNSAISETDKYASSEGKFRIPLLFYKPGDNLFFRKKMLATVQQIDIMPTILQLTGYTKPFFSFGNSIFSDTKNHYAVQYTDGFLQYIHYPYVMQIRGNKTLGFFNLTDDPFMRKNLTLQGGKLYDLYLKRLQAIYQLYNHVLISNTALAEK